MHSPSGPVLPSHDDIKLEYDDDPGFRLDGGSSRSARPNGSPSHMTVMPTNYVAQQQQQHQQQQQQQQQQYQTHHQPGPWTMYPMFYPTAQPSPVH
jgi:molybdopterin-biosynthesis enzyme MoeA-like protein